MSDDLEHSRGDAAAERRPRVDAQRNLEALLAAAKAVFAASGIEAPVREIADAAGVGVGTLYRHFPRRPDLIAAVFQQEIDDCAATLNALGRQHPPFIALQEGMNRIVELSMTKRGLAQALYSGDAAFAELPARREARLRPAFVALFEAAVAAGAIRADVNADELLNAAAGLCMSASAKHPGYAQRMVALLVDGLRAGPDARSS